MGLFRFLKVSLGGLLLLAATACSADGPGEMPADADTPAAKAAAASASSPASDPSLSRKSIPRQPQAVPSPAPLPAAAAGRDSRRGGSLIVAVMAETPHRDLHREYQETLAAPGTGLAYSRLLRIRSGPATAAGGGLALECDLCQSWELTSDWTYEFTLRPDVHWHNLAPVKGRKLTAHDLAYSYARLRTPGWPGAARFADRGLGEITALDDHTLQVRMDFRDSDGLLALADGHSKIIAPEVAAQDAAGKPAPVIGTGPWLWEDTQDGGRFRRNPDYFIPELPYLDELTLKAVKHPEGSRAVNRRRLALYRARLVDVIVAPPTDWSALHNSNAEFNARVSQQPEIGIALALNTQAQPLDNLDLRRAVFKALDPWEYVDLTWDGQGGVGLGWPLPDPDWQLTRSELHADYLADPSAARDLLAANGIHQPLPLELAVADLGPRYRALGEQVAADLQAVGFAPTIRLTPAKDLPALLFGPERDYQLVLGPLPPQPTANGYLYALLHSRGPGNVAGHRDAALDQLIERQAAELDPARRRELLREAQRRVMEQGYMFSPITGSYRWVFDWNLKNFYPNTALGEYHYWAEAWLAR